MFLHGSEPKKFPASAAAGCAAGASGGLLSLLRRGAVPLGPDGLAGGTEHLRGVCRAGRRGGSERVMTLLELSVEYREHARMLDLRICQLEAVLERTRNEKQRLVLEHRIHMLSTMLREARELAVLTERYYERGYRRNAKYTL